jgi:hypothetical protein
MTSRCACGTTATSVSKPSNPEDLYAARETAGGQIIDEADNVRLHELTLLAHPVVIDSSRRAIRTKS